MNHNNLSFFLELKNQEKSILQIAQDLYSCIKEITSQSRLFNEIYFLEKKEEIKIEFYDETSINNLAKNILNYSLDDIIKFDKIPSPDVNYSRPFGFNFSLLFKSKNSELCLNFKIGSDNRNTIGTISNKSKSNNSFDWYNIILKSFVNNLDVDFGVVRPNDMDYLDICYDNYEYSLGWITYFSKAYKFSTPNDLNNIDYMYTDNGKYLISTKDSFDNNFEDNRQKLITLMKEIADKIPEYSK